MGRRAVNVTLLAIAFAVWYFWPFLQYFAAKAQFDDSQFEKSISSFSKAIESKKLEGNLLHRAYFGRAEARIFLASYTRADDKDVLLALEDYSQAIALNSQIPIYFRSRGTAYSMLGAYDEAFADFETLRLLEGDFPMWSLVRKGGLLKRLGQYEEAHLAFQTVLGIWNEPLMPPYYHMALTYKEQGEHQLLVKAIDEGMKAQSDYGSAYKERACAKAKLGRFDEAVIDYEQGIKLDAKWSYDAGYPSFEHNTNVETKEFEYLKLLATGAVSPNQETIQKLCKQDWWHLYFDQKREKSHLLDQ